MRNCFYAIGENKGIIDEVCYGCENNRTAVSQSVSQNKLRLDPKTDSCGHSVHLKKALPKMYKQNRQGCVHGKEVFLIPIFTNTEGLGDTISSSSDLIAPVCGAVKITYYECGQQCIDCMVDYNKSHIESEKGTSFAL